MFSNENGTSVTVNTIGLCYLNLYCPTTKRDMWLQQNGASCNRVEANFTLLEESFDDKIIFRRGLVNWPRRSCNLISWLNYFLWSYVKAQVYINKPKSLHHFVKLLANFLYTGIFAQSDMKLQSSRASVLTSPWWTCVLFIIKILHS